MNYAEYLEFDEKALTKHEFIRGEIRARTVATPEHARLSTNFLVGLGNALDGHLCQPINSDQRVRVEATGDAFYPDALVACPPEEFSPVDQNALINPTLILEVVSPDTMRYDRSYKFLAYSKIESLRHLVYIETEVYHIEYFYRENSSEEWRFQVIFRHEDKLRIKSLGIELALEDIYRGVEVAEAVLPIEGAEESR